MNYQLVVECFLDNISAYDFLEMHTHSQRGAVICAQILLSMLQEVVEMYEVLVSHDVGKSTSGV